MSDRTQLLILLRNTILTAIGVGVALLYYKKGNLDAAIASLTATGALWMHSGRTPPDDPKGSVGATVLMPLFVLLAACSPPGGGAVSVSLVSVEAQHEILVLTAPRVMTATPITPITTLSAAPSGFSYAGESYDVGCTVAGSVTLYPAVYDSTLTVPAWVVYQGYPCTLYSGIATEGTCTFPARTGQGLLWNAYQTGAGGVSNCFAAGRSGPVPATRSSGGGGGGSGTVTSVGLSLPAEFTISGSPVTTSGTLTGVWASEAANTFLAGPPAGSSAAAPGFRDIVPADLASALTTPPPIGGTTPAAVSATTLNLTAQAQSLSMNSNKITGLSQGTLTTDALAAGRQVFAGTGLSGGGALTSDVTLALPNVGPGAGTIGGGSAFVNTLTLDAQGRVTAATAGTPGGRVTIPYYFPAASTDFGAGTRLYIGNNATGSYSEGDVTGARLGVAGTLTGISVGALVYGSATPALAPADCVFTMRLYHSADTAITCTVASGTSTCTATGSVTLSATSVLDAAVDLSGASDWGAAFYVSFSFQPS